ncbi:hypothetical protein [Iodobacter fluviatilis]|uniref:Fimbrial protein n=1 Tax=Iodobacter fluviatilis TaxID=537 RepID=A0A377Q5Y6_9NEIS|nr:hypothetical protein [Iodobacter fluviatilis]TCU89316.1 hypothetical protein EV682_102228 [Iodobacter fluviatilis]STQ90686.1 Uncharacterised protein [Iodobacter fluviatilis]
MKKWLFCLFILFFSCGSHAIECHLDNFWGATRVDSPVGDIFIPAAQPNGSILYVSPRYRLKIYCFSSVNYSEGIFVYPQPDHSKRIGSGISIGLVYWETDHPDFGVGAARFYASADTTFCGNQVDRHCVYMWADFSFYLKKTGDITMPYNGTDTFSLFQLDGVNGLNSQASSFQLLITGLSKIRVADCSTSVSVTPPAIDFGSLPAWSATLGQLIARKNMNISVSKNAACGAKFGVDYRFVTPSDPSLASNSLSLKNGAGISMNNAATWTYLNFNQFYDFGRLDGFVVSKDFTVDMLSTGAAKAGNFSENLVFEINYK